MHSKEKCTPLRQAGKWMFVALYCKYQSRLLSIVQQVAIFTFVYLFRIVSSFLLHLTFTMCHKGKREDPLDSYMLFTLTRLSCVNVVVMLLFYLFYKEQHLSCH